MLVDLREYLLRWLLASFLAGWHGDVDPIEEDENVTWLYIAIVDLYKILYRSYWGFVANL